MRRGLKPHQLLRQVRIHAVLLAADDTADVAALKGWRRELFGEKALALKQGRLALSIERGRVVARERS